MRRVGSATHEGRDVWVVRKGATPAFPGQRGFVGGSMGDAAAETSALSLSRSAEESPWLMQHQRKPRLSLYRGSARTIRSASIRSVFGRLARRFTCKLAGSRTWL
jgi:hypothetical protein